MFFFYSDSDSVFEFVCFGRGRVVVIISSGGGGGGYEEKEYI